MEMPCMCDCGNWFDLNDGWPSKHGSKTVCENCHDSEEEVECLENEIDAVKEAMDDKIISKRVGTSQLRELNKKLASAQKEHVRL
jgi:hypothetical protein